MSDNQLDLDYILRRIDDAQDAMCNRYDSGSQRNIKGHLAWAIAQLETILRMKLQRKLTWRERIKGYIEY